MKKDERIGYLCIVLTAIIFSTMEIALKLVAGVFEPMQITMLRFLVGGILLTPIALKTLEKKNITLHLKDMGGFAYTGFLCVLLSMVIYQMAVTNTKASVVAVIFSCNPIFVTILAFLILKEAIYRHNIIALILEVVGILVIVNPLHTELNMLGVGLSILSAVLFALYAVLGKKKTKAYGSIAVTCFSFIFGSLELMAVLLLGKTALFGSLFSALGLHIFVNVSFIQGITLQTLPVLIYICAVNSAAGYVCHMMAMEKTSASKASLVFFLKPIIAPILAWIVLREVIGIHMVIGILFFLGGSLISILPGLLQKEPDPAIKS